MPLPLPPTILLAVGGLLLVAGPWVRDARWSAVAWLAGWLCASYLLAMSGLAPMDAAARMALRSVWAADELAVTGQWLALSFGLMFGVGSLGMASRGGGSAERFGFLSFLVESDARHGGQRCDFAGPLAGDRAVRVARTASDGSSR